MVVYSETIEVYDIKVSIYCKLNEWDHGDIHLSKVKVIVWPLSKVTEFETWSQVSDIGPIYNPLNNTFLHTVSPNAFINDVDVRMLSRKAD